MAQAKTLTKQELKQVVDVTRACSRYAERDVTMLLMTHYCGLRVSEVASLQIKDVLDNNGAVRAEFVLGAERTKSKSARTVFLPSKMQKQLQRYIAGIKLHAQRTYLFITQKNKQFSANTATQHLKGLYVQAGITGATSHSGRRTFLTNLAAKGVSVRVLAELAGHKNWQVTMRYVDASDEMMRNAVELI
jgi:integrase/recombinase XerD